MLHSYLGRNALGLSRRLSDWGWEQGPEFSSVHEMEDIQILKITSYESSQGVHSCSIDEKKKVQCFSKISQRKCRVVVKQGPLLWDFGFPLTRWKGYCERRLWIFSQLYLKHRILFAQSILRPSSALQSGLGKCWCRQYKGMLDYTPHCLSQMPHIVSVNAAWG